MRSSIIVLVFACLVTGCGFTIPVRVVSDDTTPNTDKVFDPRFEELANRLLAQREVDDDYTSNDTGPNELPQADGRDATGTDLHSEPVQSDTDVAIISDADDTDSVHSLDIPPVKQVPSKVQEASAWPEGYWIQLLTTSYCPPCKKWVAEEQPKLKGVRVDIMPVDKDTQAKELSDELKIFLVPAYVIRDADGSIVTQTTSFKTAAELIELANEAPDEPDAIPLVRATCNCSSQCVCGCQQGQKCSCGSSNRSNVVRALSRPSVTRTSSMRWTVNGSYHPSKSTLISHLRSAHGYSQAQLEGYSTEELRTIHDNAHNAGRSSSRRRSIFSWGSK